MRRNAAWLAIVGWTACLIGSTALADGPLTPADIEALRAQGQVEGWTFTVGENEATSRSLDELCGLVVPDKWWVDAPFDPCPPKRDLPSSFDWRTLGGCTPVKNQGGCGSCWAFATVGPLECNIKIKDGITVDLSEQWLVSCNSSGYDCGGGWWAHDYHEWRSDPCGQTGAVMEDDFPYVAWDAPCNCPYPHEYYIDSWAFVGSSSAIPPVSSMKQAIMDYGPINVGIYANSAMQGYNGGIFNGCDSSQGLNHGVVLVGWDDNQGTSGVWFMRNSWGTGWGEDGGYMRIPYGCSLVGYAAAYVDYTQTWTVDFSYPEGRPEFASPTEPTAIRVDVTPNTGTPEPGTAQLHYRLDGTYWYGVWMTEIGTNQYEASLPPADCFSVYDWWISANIIEGGTARDPEHAPYEYYQTLVATESEMVFEDDFETDLGWTVGDPGDDATTGIWNRADPEGTEAQPEDDHTPSPGADCWVTDSRAGSSLGDWDVDGGKTTLFSPIIDLSGGDAVIGYWRWYSNDTGAGANEDVFVVDISNNGGSSWTNAETVGPSGSDTSGGWIYHEFSVNDFVTPTAQVRMRFIAADEGDGSLVEAAVDDFVVHRLTCDPGPSCDDGELNQEEERIDCGGPCPPCTCVSDGNCANDEFCDGMEICDAYGECQPGTDPCSADFWCDEGFDECRPVTARVFAVPVGVPPRNSTPGTAYRMTASGGEQVVFDVYVENTGVQVRAWQNWFDCAVTGTETGSVTFASNSVDEHRADYIFYDLTIQYPITENQGDCEADPFDAYSQGPRAANLALYFGEYPIVTEARYMSTWTFEISPDAVGVFTIRPYCSWGDGCWPMDRTNLIDPYLSFIGFNLDALEVDVPYGQCCDGDTCLGDYTEYDCLNNQGGTQWNPNKSCDAGDPCGCSSDEDCDDGDPCTVDTCDSQSGACTNTCQVRLYGDVSPAPNGDGTVEIYDILCVLDAAGATGDCTMIMPSGFMLADIWPCWPPNGIGPDGAVEIMDILAVLDAADGTPGCPDPCTCP